MSATLTGGSIRILWDASDSADVTITGGVASFTVNGSPVTFPYTLTSSTTFTTTHSGVYTVSVQHYGYEIAGTPDGTRQVTLRFGEEEIFAPTPDSRASGSGLGAMVRDIVSGDVADDTSDIGVALASFYASARPVDMRSEPGVDPTGATDISTAVQTAVDRANSIGAKKVWRDGTYKFSGVTDAPGNNKNIDWSTDGGTVVFKPATGAGATMLTIDGGTSNRQRQSIKGLLVDLNNTDARFLLTKGFGGRGVVEDVTIFNPSATLTNPMIQLGDGVSAPNNVVAGHIKNVKIRGASTTNGVGIRFGSRMDSFAFEGVHLLNIGTGVDTDPSHVTAGSSLRFYGECIFEQMTTGLSLLDIALSSLTVRDTRFEACSTVAVDLRGYDSTNNLMQGIGISDCYVSGLGATSIGFRLNRTKGVEFDGIHIRALDGLGSYPTAVPFSWTSPNYRVRLRRITTDPVSSVSPAMTGYSNLFNRNDCMVGELYSFDSQVLMGGAQAVKQVAGTGVVSDASFTLPNGTTQAIVNGTLAMNEAGELWGKYGPPASAGGTWKKVALV